VSSPSAYPHPSPMPPQLPAAGSPRLRRPPPPTPCQEGRWGRGPPAPHLGAEVEDGGISYAFHATPNWGGLAPNVLGTSAPHRYSYGPRVHVRVQHRVRSSSGWYPGEAEGGQLAMANQRFIKL
jgi:hypothetical protein